MWDTACRECGVAVLTYSECGVAVLTYSGCASQPEWLYERRPPRSVRAEPGPDPGRIAIRARVLSRSTHVLHHPTNLSQIAGIVPVLKMDPGQIAICVPVL